jgi:threonine dehydratase
MSQNKEEYLLVIAQTLEVRNGNDNDFDAAIRVAQRLKTEALQRGESEEQYTIEALEERLSEAERINREEAVALLQSWIDEDIAAGDETSDDEFFQQLDEDRPADEKLFPPELKGVSW